MHAKRHALADKFANSATMSLVSPLVPGTKEYCICVCSSIMMNDVWCEWKSVTQYAVQLGDADGARGLGPTEREEKTPMCVTYNNWRRVRHAKPSRSLDV